MQNPQAATVEIIHKKKQALLIRLETIANYAEEYLNPAIHVRMADINNQKLKLEHSKVQAEISEDTQELVQGPERLDSERFDVPYELVTPVYPVYINYLAALRQFGYVIADIREHKDAVHTLFTDVHNLFMEIAANNPFPSQLQFQETQKVLSSIAIKLERYRGELGHHIEVLNEEMLQLANKYRLDGEFKTGIDKQLAQLAENERNELLQWTKPYLDYLNTNGVDLYDTLSAAIATLNIVTQHNNVIELRAS